MRSHKLNIFIVSIRLLMLGIGQRTEAHSVSQSNATATAFVCESLLRKALCKPRKALAMMLLAGAPCAPLHRASRALISKQAAPRASALVAKTSDSKVSIMTRLKECGIAELNSLQNAALAPALLGKDVIVHAETGSGKTLCFAVPLLSRLPPFRKHVQALVMAPTLFLASQIARVLNTLKPGCAQHLVSKDDTLPESQIVIGTPGMLLRALSLNELKRQVFSVDRDGGLRESYAPGKSGKIELDQTLIQDLRMIVLDEIDALLKTPGRYSPGRVKYDHERHRTPAATLLSEAVNLHQDEVQIIATSATVGRPLRRELARISDRSFMIVNDDQKSAGSHVANTTDRKVVLPPTLKVEVETTYSDNVIAGIYDILARVKSSSALLFIPSHYKVDETVKFLRTCDLNAVDFHEVLSDQKGLAPTVGTSSTAADEGTQQTKLLVAEQSSARGIDLYDIDLVVIMGIPTDTDEFMHLAGRTARQGKNGTVVLLTTQQEADSRLSPLVSHLGLDLDGNTYPLYERNDRSSGMWSVFIKRYEERKSRWASSSAKSEKSNAPSEGSKKAKKKPTKLSKKKRKILNIPRPTEILKAKRKRKIAKAIARRREEKSLTEA